MRGAESFYLRDESANVAFRGDLDTSQRAGTCQSCNAPVPKKRAILGDVQHAIQWIGYVVIGKIGEGSFEL